uniref:Late embryogenesis abundant protein LEA-2 subgroup domain-containing protein n=1 Tax=Leersia perrieri TaxID=77586 RepID=A0A0D9V9B0_9ORYZ
MSKQPAAPLAASGIEPRSRSRSSGAAPSTRAAPAPALPRHREETVHDVRHAVTPHDGAAVPGGPPRPAQRTRVVTYETEVRTGRDPLPLPDQSPVHGDGAEAPARTPHRTPSYLPAWRRRTGDGQPQPTPPPRRTSTRSRPVIPPPPPRPTVPEYPLAPAPALVPAERARPPIDTQKTILRTSTIKDDDGALPDEQVPSAGAKYLLPRWEPQQQPRTTAPKFPPLGAPHDHPDTSPSPEMTHASRPMIFPVRKQKGKRPVAFCFTACCILFWLLVIALGSAVLVIFLLYHPQSPKMRVTSATLNAGYIDELGSGGGGAGGELGSTGGPRALNADVTVLAAIYNPNTKLHVVLRYMQLDLYFEGSMIATQAVWPAPLHEGPRGSVLRSVHLVVSEVTVTQEDVSVWQNATAKGGPVVLHLAGRFRTVLIFGRWFKYKYWVRPQCTLWLDPPPSGALRHVRC